jgi:hypothetical protein
MVMNNFEDNLLGDNFYRDVDISLLNRRSNLNMFKYLMKDMENFKYHYWSNDLTKEEFEEMVVMLDHEVEKLKMILFSRIKA